MWFVSYLKKIMHSSLHSDIKIIYMYFPHKHLKKEGGKKKEKKVRTCIRGHNFKFGYCIWWHNLHRPWWKFLIYILIPHFPPCTFLSPIYDNWRSLKSCKLQRSRLGKLQSVFTTLARNRPYIDHECTAVTCPFKLARDVQPYW